jgi:nucleotide-binding universal stress UspA family protein
MKKTILVPLDGSVRAERALLVAARLARSSGGKVMVLRVMNWQTLLVPAFISEAIPSPLLIQKEREEEEQYLSRIVQSPLFIGIETETLHSEGDAAEMILDAAKRTGAGLIVLCRHGRTGFLDSTLGSVAAYVMHRASMPVLLLHEYGPLPLPLHPDPSSLLRLLVPLDGTLLAEEALPPALQLAAFLSEDAPFALHLVRVIPDLSEKQEELVVACEYDLNCLQARKYLQLLTSTIRSGAFVDACSSEHFSITTEIATGTDVAQALIQVAEDGKQAGRCNLIAMTTHTHSGLKRLILGSVSERVLHATHLPLLMVCPTRSVANSGSKPASSVEM